MFFDVPFAAADRCDHDHVVLPPRECEAALLFARYFRARRRAGEPAAHSHHRRAGARLRHRRGLLLGPHAARLDGQRVRRRRLARPVRLAGHAEEEGMSVKVLLAITQAFALTMSVAFLVYVVVIVVPYL